MCGQFRCGQCGSPNVECKAWVRINTFRIVEGEDSLDNWCEDCEERDVILVESYVPDDLYAHIFDD